MNYRVLGLVAAFGLALAGNSAAKEVRPRLAHRHKTPIRKKTLIFIFNKKENANQNSRGRKQNC